MLSVELTSFEGGTWGCEKIWMVPYFCVLLHFWLEFLKSFFGGGGGGEGTFRAPFLLPPSCVYLSPVWLRLLRVIVMNWGSKFIWEILPAKIHFKWLRHRGKEETSCLWFCGGVFWRSKITITIEIHEFWK